MYGNDTYLDANGNPHPLIGGYLTSRPDGAYMPPVPDPYFYVTQVATVPGFPTLFDLTTNITVGDSTFYGYDFTRWTLRVSYTAPGQLASLLSLLTRGWSVSPWRSWSTTAPPRPRAFLASSG